MLKFIQNIGEYFPSNYFDEDFAAKVIRKSEIQADERKQIQSHFRHLKEHYFKYKKLCMEQLRTKDLIWETHRFHTRLLELLGYESSQPYHVPYYLTDNEVIPVRHTLCKGDSPFMLVMEMQPLFAEGDNVPDGLFQQCYNTPEGDRMSEHQRYHRSQWKRVISDVMEWPAIAPTVINKAVSQIFLQEPRLRPQYILLLAGNRLYFLEQEKWFRGAFLEFDLEELFSEATVYGDYYAAFFALLSKQTLASDANQVLMQAIEEDAHKSAYEVTKDLKEGIIWAVEALANEAVYYQQQLLGEQFDETNGDYANTIKDEALTIIYRLLFIFYAESREELDILPSNNTVYERGYSLEMLRDLEQSPLQSNGAQNGYFFDDSLKTLFRLLSNGYREEDRNQLNRSFEVRHIDSPLFNDKRLSIFSKVRIRNLVWQQIICRLSLSKQVKGKNRGRISYANLGINQLGSVYESLLAYRGFYASEDLMEVHLADKPDEERFLVPYVRRDYFQENEILKDDEGRDVIMRKGSFVYRLNGRDRTKSASYYTPESLTRATVKYSLKGYLERIEKGEMRPIELLKLKLLEPAMGAAAFHNEMINQLAEAYLTTQQKYKKQRIAPECYREEIQRVKAYIATNNVYGVDLNPTAVELGKLSLWLNVIHKEMETPFFGNRLCVGNAVVGAWLKVYNEKQVVAQKGRENKLLPTAWWEHAPKPVPFLSTKVNRRKSEIYHFLLPDKQMLAVLGIKELKSNHEQLAKGMTELRKSWIAPISRDEFNRLCRISDRIDELLKEYMTQQLNLQRLTQNLHHVWGTEERRRGESDGIFKDYDAKENLFNIRNNKDSAYYKLRTVMDYWCALWYWDFKCGELPPTRNQYWDDIEAIVNVTFVSTPSVRVAYRKAHLFDDTPQLTIFDSPEYNRVTVEETDNKEIYETTQSDEISEELFTQQTAEELLAEQHGGTTLFEEAGRIPVVQQMAKRYRFFHPQLEFLEVFWLRGGFDLICGNPPWLKLEYKEQDIISEKFPEVAIRKVSAPDVRKIREKLMEDKELLTLIEAEQVENEATKIFLNAFVNYPLLVGQKTNLYKCILTNGFAQLSSNGFMGLVHPEGIYDDANAQPLRREVYPRLRYHFQFINEMSLFSEVHHNTVFGIQVYRGDKLDVFFRSIHNLFHPSTIDSCFTHSGFGVCEGYKRYDEVSDRFVWNMNGHKDRIVHFDEKALRTLALTFEDSDDWQGAKLVSIHAEPFIRVLENLSEFKTSVRNFQPILTQGLNEVMCIDKGIMRRQTGYPDFARNEMIFSGPHLYVCNPLYKTPRSKCLLNSDYDIIDHTQSNAATVARTNYVPACDQNIYRSYINGFDESNPWIDQYKLGFRKMLSQAGERTLSGAILPPMSSHTNGVISAVFKEVKNVVELAGLTSSIILDFFMKTIGADNLYEQRLSSFPLGLNARYLPALYVRTLRLNCVNEHYKALWAEMWQETYKSEQWAGEDKRLASFAGLTSEWNEQSTLRNWYERRWALVEIDVIVAMALGVSLEDLCLIYDMQFPVLQQNEMDTWYDTHGQIVFTCSKGLTGVGVDRKTWNLIQADAQAAADLNESYSYEHVITNSELYQGSKQLFIAPFDKCDRKADYRKVWKVFEKRFK